MQYGVERILTKKNKKKAFLQSQNQDIDMANRYDQSLQKVTLFPTIM